MIKVKRALISVSDKKGVATFAKALHALGIEILSTGGTAKHLKESGVSVIEVSDYTGFPEMLDGRVKTLHPKIHAGLLAVRDNPEHMNDLKKHNIGLIDMVVVNLYPFDSVTKKKNVSFEEAIENIDIGGPTMLRSAAKNFKSVAVVCNPDKYQDILRELDVNTGILSDAVLYQLAVEVFEHTSRYDGLITDYLKKRLSSEEFSTFPKKLSWQFTKLQDLRYGENPHQKAAFYRDEQEPNGLSGMKKLSGKELSFNNILDINAAVDFIKEFSNPTAVIIKHNNPAGLAEDTTLANAYRQAYACDPMSAFGGIIGVNQKLDVATAKLIEKSGFMECIVAPAFHPDALSMLSQKKNVRLVEIDLEKMKKGGLDFKKVNGGILVQEKDEKSIKSEDLKVVTKKKPTPSQIDALLFGWKAIRNIKSNAIALVKDTRLVGVGCGQTSRIESMQTAVTKAKKNARGSLLISDAFFPKTDNIKLAAKAGIKAIIQPGGSIADPDVIKECDKAGIAMVFTGVRHFKH
jgi:phosphoribosylaminoimidazolecarboxamide formyltransferase/IMP cyclohydrolase